MSDDTPMTEAQARAVVTLFNEGTEAKEDGGAWVVIDHASESVIRTVREAIEQLHDELN